MRQLIVNVNLILLTKDNKITYYDMEITEEISWGASMYKTILIQINLSNKFLNIRLIKE